MQATFVLPSLAKGHTAYLSETITMRSKLLVGAALLAGTTMWTQAANAVQLQLTIDVGGATQTLTGTDSIPLSTTINGVSIVGDDSTAINGVDKILDTSETTITNNNATPITIKLVVSGQGYGGPANTLALSTSGTWQATAGSSISEQWYNDPNNKLGGSSVTDTPGNQVATYNSSTAVGSTSSFSYSPAAAALLVPDVGAFSMTEALTYTLAAGGTLISEGTTEISYEVAVPEPAPLALLGMGLLGFAGLRRSRRA